MERPLEPDPLRELIERRAVEGCELSAEGVRFHRVSSPRVFHKTHALGPVLTVVAQGSKVARFGARSLAYDPATCIVVTGEATYEAEVVDAAPGRPYLAASVDIPVELVVKTVLALPEPEAPAEADAVPAFATGFDAAMKGTVTRYLEAILDPLERRIVAPLALEELTFRLLRSGAADVVRAAIRGRDARVIHRAMRFIRARAADEISVEDIARHVAMSPSHFAHRFRAVAGITPMRYLKNARLEEARAAILGGDLRVGEVASRVGYESASHFTRDFKAKYGAAPAAYARRVTSRLSS